MKIAAFFYNNYVVFLTIIYHMEKKCLISLFLICCVIIYIFHRSLILFTIFNSNAKIKSWECKIYLKSIIFFDQQSERREKAVQMEKAHRYEGRARLCDLCDWPIVVLNLRECQGTVVGHALFRSTREK